MANGVDRPKRLFANYSFLSNNIARMTKRIVLFTNFRENQVVKRAYQLDI